MHVYINSLSLQWVFRYDHFIPFLSVSLSTSLWKNLMRLYLYHISPSRSTSRFPSPGLMFSLVQISLPGCLQEFHFSWGLQTALQPAVQLSQENYARGALTWCSLAYRDSLPQNRQRDWMVAVRHYIKPVPDARFSLHKLPQPNFSHNPAKFPSANFRDLLKIKVSNWYDIMLISKKFGKSVKRYLTPNGEFIVLEIRVNNPKYLNLDFLSSAAKLRWQIFKFCCLWFEKNELEHTHF